MGVVYQLTFFLALGILAIVTTIFVFAISLLGRAIEVASKEQEKATREQKNATENEITKIQKQISALMKKERIGRELKELEKKLKQLRKQDKKFEKKLRRIETAPELLRVKGAVIHPSIFLGIALTLVGVAWYLSSIKIPTVPIIIWGLGLAAIGYSIYRIYCSLKVVESVAITSEEAALRREIEAYKIAQKELEEERTPVLALLFETTKFELMKYPLHVKANSELDLILRLRMLQGNYAEEVEVHLAVPHDFSFPNEGHITALSPDTGFVDYIDFVWERGEVKRGMTYRKGLTIKMPTKTGNYNFVYWIFGRGFYTDPTELEVIVE